MTMATLRIVLTLTASLVLLLFVVSNETRSNRRKLLEQKRYLVVGEASSSLIARKLSLDLAAAAAANPSIDTLFLNRAEQLAYVQKCNVQDTYQRLQPHLATQLFQYCAATQSFPKYDGVVLVDPDSPILIRLETVLSKFPNLAILGDDSYFPHTIHGSMIALTSAVVAREMMEILVHNNNNIDPLVIPKSLYNLVARELQQTDTIITPGAHGDWYILQQKCHGSLNNQKSNINHVCADGFCCSIQYQGSPALMTRYPLFPYEIIPFDDVPAPFRANGDYNPRDLPFISTVRQVVHEKPADFPATPNFYETLLANECLPDSDECSKCLRNKSGANCQTCGKVCSCYCKALCHEKVEQKFIGKEWTVTPPSYRRDPNRLVPRIVHQTWYEDLDPEKYPNMSRLVESFKRSGWEYVFYSDEEAQSFLTTHFPPEVREVYDTIRPGAFKADLFRYCALLIYGGVYADVDIMLESNLDFVVSPDVGFMVPVDEPGSTVDHRMCLWNGLIASAPGHPVLAQAIETIVNQVRNRFTSVDVDATFCPDPELSVLHAFDTLFTAGPCLLGSSLNRYLGRKGQTSFHDGEQQHQSSSEATSDFGRIIILHQDKWDMGSHRFSDRGRNLVVAATDLEDSDDRVKDDSSGKTEHYSKTHAKTGIYGLNGLYIDDIKADENISFRVSTLSSSQVLVK